MLAFPLAAVGSAQTDAALPTSRERSSDPRARDAVVAAPLAPPGCFAGPVDAAARELVHPGAEVAGVDELGALVLAPIVFPGVRHRLVEHDGLWCDAQRAANLLGSGTAVERASVFATTAAAPWFDGVTVLDARETLPGVVELTTHARTNGILATWIVRVDGQGVRDATWTATAIAVEPFEAEIEGLTALPGLARSYARAPTGLVELTEPILPQTPSPTSSVFATDTYSDGFRITFHLATTQFFPTAAEPLPTDELRAVTRENYEEYLSWGLHKGWSSNLGHVYLNDAVAAQCIACVFIAQDFNIHISSAVVPILAVLVPATYPDDRAAFSTVVGHEMFHNFQNAYSKPSNGVFMGGAYSEGLARFTEALHTYSVVSHQPDSLVYSSTGNGCNAELGAQFGTPLLQDGPATGQSYSACDFWLSFYGQHGLDGLVGVLEASPVHRHKTGWDEIKSVVEDAIDAPVDDTLAHFAAAMSTGAGLTWAPAVGPGPTLDWNEYLLGWPMTNLNPGGSVTTRLTDGGMLGARVTVDGILTSDEPAAALYVVRDDGTFTRVSSGASVDAPARVVAIFPGLGEISPRLSYA